MTKLSFHVVSSSWEMLVYVANATWHHLPPAWERMIKLAWSSLASSSHCILLLSVLASSRKCVWVRRPAECGWPDLAPMRALWEGKQGEKSEDGWVKGCIVVAGGWLSQACMAEGLSLVFYAVTTFEKTFKCYVILSQLKWQKPICTYLMEWDFQPITFCRGRG